MLSLLRSNGLEAICYTQSYNFSTVTALAKPGRTVATSDA